VPEIAALNTTAPIALRLASSLSIRAADEFQDGLAPTRSLEKLPLSRISMSNGSRSIARATAYRQGLAPRCLMFPHGASVAKSIPRLPIALARPARTTADVRARFFVNDAPVEVYEA